ncbi:MAG: DUF2007 domain-containing protein [Methyloglobulus sp.]|nr:DUF2007 domain-containing protein [Methyloglobulus sp.]
MKKQVYTADNSVAAQLVKGLLVAQGITAEIREEGMIGDYPSVWVLAGTDYELAKGIISVMSHRQAGVETPGDPWLCARCGESIETQFTECWHCGTNQPSV